jgi:hypothetical protein
MAEYRITEKKPTVSTVDAIFKRTEQGLDIEFYVEDPTPEEGAIFMDFIGRHPKYFGQRNTVLGTRFPNL